MQREMKSRCVSHGKKEREIEEGGGKRNEGREAAVVLCVCVCARVRVEGRRVLPGSPSFCLCFVGGLVCCPVV